MLWKNEQKSALCEKKMSCLQRNNHLVTAKEYQVHCHYVYKGFRKPWAVSMETSAARRSSKPGAQIGTFFSRRQPRSEIVRPSLSNKQTSIWKGQHVSAHHRRQTVLNVWNHSWLNKQGVWWQFCWQLWKLWHRWHSTLDGGGKPSCQIVLKF